MEKITHAFLQPGDEGYHEARTSWNLYAQQDPALIVVAESTSDIIAAVQFARNNNMGIGVMATGHGVSIRCNGGLLINTSRMRGVTIDPDAQTATVQAGALWKDVRAAAHGHGLVGLAGSSSHVGVVGYTMGGGYGFLGRKYGLNADSIVAAEVITADGKLLRVSADENAELFHGLKGSAGNFGIITSLTCRLYPLTTVFGGAVFYPVENAREALDLYARWCAHIPDDITAAFAFMNFPPLPQLPEVIRGRRVVVIKGCYCGDHLSYGEDLFRPVRNELGEPVMDTFRIMHVDEMDTISNDPVEPMGVLQYGCFLSDLSADAMETLVQVAGAGSGSPVALVEIRILGGALQQDKNHFNLMGKGTSRYSLNAIGASAVDNVNSYLKMIADKTSRFKTGQTFVNFVEADADPDCIRSAYTAGDWERLVALKKKYDPTNLFRFNRNIPPQ